jgi:hypothetical protein
MRLLYPLFHKAIQRKVSLAMEKTSVNIPDPNQLRKFQSADSEYRICHPIDTGALSALSIEFLDDQGIN